MHTNYIKRRDHYKVPLAGLGSCNPLGVSYSNTPNGACRDNSTGNIVDCKATACSTATAVPGSSNPAGPNLTPVWNTEQIQVGGIVGAVTARTLDSYLQDRLAAKMSPFIANAIAKGADSVDAEDDFAALASDYCNIYGSLSDCYQQSQLAAKYSALWRQWAGGQSAGTYQSGATGTLTNPNALTSSVPSGGVVNPAPTQNVLTSPSGQSQVNPGSTQLVNTIPPAGASLPDLSGVTSWIEDNWVILAATAGGIFLMTTMGKGR